MPYFKTLSKFLLGLVRRCSFNAIVAPRWVNQCMLAAAGIVVLLGCPAFAGNGTDPCSSAGRHSITYDHYSIIIDGKRTFIYCGEYHPFRLPSPDLWRDVFEKMKAAGFNAVSTYFDWDFHSPARGVYDFSGVRDLDRFLDEAAAVGIYVIVRPGPYINAETDSGGFPGWLTTIKGLARSTAPDYLDASDEWLSRVDPIIARHQYTNGQGTVIGYQIENEYYVNTPEGRAYMQHLEDKARADKINVPFTGNHNANFVTGLGATDLVGFDSYPQGFNATTPLVWSPVPDFTGDYENLPPDKPLFLSEFQGGSFDPWGGAGTANLYKLTGPDFENVFYKSLIAQGATMLNFYMAYGGTNWGWLPEPTVYTSYDYGAAINEQRQLTGKYTAQKLIASFTQAVPQLAATLPIQTDAPSNSRLILVGRANRDVYTQVLMVRHADGTSTSTEKTHIPVDLNPQFGSDPMPAAQSTPAGPGWVYPSVPQQPNTAITVNGRDAKLLLANYRFGSQRLIYSTSQLMTNGTSGAEDFAVLYDNPGNDGETVLRYPSKPEVDVVEGVVTSTFDSNVGDLRLNYKHDGLASVVIKNGKSVLYLFLADAAIAGEFWKSGTPDDPILLRGPYLVRSASRSGSVVTARGDTDTPAAPKVYFPPAAKQLVWKGVVGTAPEINLPMLNSWKFEFETPERNPAFDDASWTVANQTTTNNPNAPGSLPVLYEDQYGFHHGSVWYRGHFIATGKETGITLDAEGGSPGIYSVWFNGAFLGTFPSGSTDLPFPGALLNPGKDNTVAVLVMNMGHDEDWTQSSQSWKSPRGIRTAILQGANPVMTWKIQGSRGGEHLVDPVRGPMNMGGLFGERQGWFLPGFPDSSWSAVSTPDRWETRKLVAGVGWYRTTFELRLPASADVPINLEITDDPARHYRALIFLNGWMMGIYANDLGPQHAFSLPTGILNPNGENDLAISVWGEDNRSGGLGNVRLVAAGAYWGGVPVRQVESPGWSAQKWGEPTAPESLVVGVTTDQKIIFTDKTVDVVSYLTNLSTVPAQQVAVSLSAPDGWDLGQSPTLTLPVLNPNQSVTLTWSIRTPHAVSPGPQQLTVKATYASGAGAQNAGGVATLQGPYPSLVPLYDNAAVSSNSHPNPSAGFTGFDGGGTAFSAEGLAEAGITPRIAIKSGGVQFIWPDVETGSFDNVLANGQVVALSGKGRRIGFLGISNNAPVNGTGTVVYTDGTSTPYTVSVGNFWSPAGQNGNPANPQVAAVNFANNSSGSTGHTVYLFPFFTPINPAKTVYAVVLPNGQANVTGGNPAMHIFSLGID